MNNKVAIQLGSNQGNRQFYLREAKQILNGFISTEQESPIYETAAWGIEDQQDFYNQVIVGTTELNPYRLLEACLLSERIMGRERDVKWGPRIIDIDIIYYSNKIIFSPDLKIPHPYMQDRRFVLEPLAKIAPHWQHPLLKKKTLQLLADCGDRGTVKLINS